MIPSRVRRWLRLLPLAVTVALGPAAAAAATHVVLVTGIGGEPYYAERFHSWSRTFHEVTTQRLGVPATRLVWLAPAGDADKPGVTGEARKSAVLEAVARWRQDTNRGDVLALVLIGHGTATDGRALFNLPGPDLSAAELATALAGLDGRTLVVVNAASASAPFLQALSGPERIIVTATATPRENEFTRFGGYFAEAHAASAADADKNGKVSVLEAFEYARTAVARSYAEERILLTEHAMLDDNGDGKGSPEPIRSEVEGALARSVFLADAPEVAAAESERRLALGIEARALVERIQTLKRRRHLLREAEFDAELEELLVELALNRRAYRETDGS